MGGGKGEALTEVGGRGGGVSRSEGRGGGQEDEHEQYLLREGAVSALRPVLLGFRV